MIGVYCSAVHTFTTRRHSQPGGKTDTQSCADIHNQEVRLTLSAVQTFTTRSTLDQDSNLNLPIIGILVYCESSTLNHTAAKAVFELLKDPNIGHLRHYANEDTQGLFHHDLVIVFRQDMFETVVQLVTRLEADVCEELSSLGDAFTLDAKQIVDKMHVLPYHLTFSFDLLQLQRHHDTPIPTANPPKCQVLQVSRKHLRDILNSERPPKSISVIFNIQEMFLSNSSLGIDVRNIDVVQFNSDEAMLYLGQREINVALKEGRCTLGLRGSGGMGGALIPRTFATRIHETLDITGHMSGHHSQPAHVRMDQLVQGVPFPDNPQVSMSVTSFTALSEDKRLNPSVCRLTISVNSLMKSLLGGWNSRFMTMLRGIASFPDPPPECMHPSHFLSESPEGTGSVGKYITNCVMRLRANSFVARKSRPAGGFEMLPRIPSRPLTKSISLLPLGGTSLWYFCRKHRRTELTMIRFSLSKVDCSCQTNVMQAYHPDDVGHHAVTVVGGVADVLGQQVSQLTAPLAAGVSAAGQLLMLLLDAPDKLTLTLDFRLQQDEPLTQRLFVHVWS
uniref:Uncharacterized protein n=1 Tax=Timema tahoe TaxID=61484 RepID=A0A7R9IR30_9NEOP|nr:unnamed protein product [Timema tahoe]